MESHHCRMIRHHGFRNRLRNCPRHSPWRKAVDLHHNPRRDRTGFQPVAAPRRLRLPAKSGGDERACSPAIARIADPASNGSRRACPDSSPWSRWQEFNPHEHVRSVPCFALHHTGRWCARPDLHGHCSALGPRLTVCCRRARGPHGRISTCLFPFRRRAPDVLGHMGKWSPRMDSHHHRNLRTVASFFWTTGRRSGAPCRNRTGLTALQGRGVAPTLTEHWWALSESHRHPGAYEAPALALS